MTGGAREHVRTGPGRRTPEGPTVLRSMRHAPALVDDRAAARRLADATALSTDDARWARAWLVCSQAAVTTEPRFGADESATLAFDPRRVPVPKGMADPARRTAVLDALVAAGVLRPAAPAPERLRWAPEVCQIHSAASALDWTGLVAACGREPAALLVLRALAEYVLPAAAWTVVPRRDLVERTGYAQKQVRVALRRLAGAGLIDAGGEAGQTARYRFTPRALAARWGEASDAVPRGPFAGPAPVTAAPAVSAAIAAAPRADAPRADASAANGVDVVLGGVTVHMAAGAALDVGAGTRAQVEVGPDGRLRLRIDPS